MIIIIKPGMISYVFQQKNPPPPLPRKSFRKNGGMLNRALPYQKNLSLYTIMQSRLLSLFFVPSFLPSFQFLFLFTGCGPDRTGLDWTGSLGRIHITANCSCTVPHCYVLYIYIYIYIYYYYCTVAEIQLLIVRIDH